MSSSASTASRRRACSSQGDHESPPNRPLQQAKRHAGPHEDGLVPRRAGCARGSSRPWYGRRRPWRSLLNGRSLGGHRREQIAAKVTFFLLHELRPIAGGPHDGYGGAFAACWAVAGDLTDARTEVAKLITDDGWTVLSTTEEREILRQDVPIESVE